MTKAAFPLRGKKCGLFAYAESGRSRNIGAGYSVYLKPILDPPRLPGLR